MNNLSIVKLIKKDFTDKFKLLILLSVLTKMFVKIIKSYRDVVAICDSNLLGKKYEEGQFQLDVREGFYKGEEMDEKGVRKIILKMLKEDATFNIVGEESVSVATNLGLIQKEGIKKIQGIPFAMVLI